VNPLHSLRNEHSKTEFGKKNFDKFFGELETFPGSRFDPATGVSPLSEEHHTTNES